MTFLTVMNQGDPTIRPLSDRGDYYHHTYGKGGKGVQSALSALTLLAFLFFLNLLQTCLREQLLSQSPIVIMMTTTTTTTTQTKRHRNEQIIKKTDAVVPSSSTIYPPVMSNTSLRPSFVKIGRPYRPIRNKRSDKIAVLQQMDELFSIQKYILWEKQPEDLHEQFNSKGDVGELIVQQEDAFEFDVKNTVTPYSNVLSEDSQRNGLLDVGTLAVGKENDNAFHLPFGQNAMSCCKLIRCQMDEYLYGKPYSFFIGDIVLKACGGFSYEELEKISCSDLWKYCSEDDFALVLHNTIHALMSQPVVVEP